MLKLCGFPSSNYYNKVKLILLEKGVPFEEELVYPSRDSEFLKRSPMGKVPFIESDAGSVAESQPIVEYLEEAYTGVSLYPSDLVARARCRNLIQVLELYLEWPARRLYPAAMFGATASDELKKEVHSHLRRGLRAFAPLVRCDPYILGTEFTLADCVAYAHLPLISSTVKGMYGTDLFEEIPAVKPYLLRIAQRPHFQRVNADRKANLEPFLAYIKSKV